MRRMRSESWTFIWQPKVRMQAVLAPSGTPRGLSPGPGFLETRTGVTVRGVSTVSLILFLRLVDAGSHADLTRADLELDLPNLEVAGPRRPPKYSRHGASFFLSQREHRPIAQPRTGLLPSPCYSSILPLDGPGRSYLSAPHPLHRP